MQSAAAPSVSYFSWTVSTTNRKILIYTSEGVAYRGLVPRAALRVDRAPTRAVLDAVDDRELKAWFTLVWEGDGEAAREVRVAAHRV